MLVTCIFSFSHYVFNRLLFQGCLKSPLCGKELNLFVPILDLSSADIFNLEEPKTVLFGKELDIRKYLENWEIASYVGCSFSHKVSKRTFFLTVLQN